MMSDVHSWGNLPYEWSCKQAELLHLGSNGRMKFMSTTGLPKS